MKDQFAYDGGFNTSRIGQPFGDLFGGGANTVELRVKPGQAGEIGLGGFRWTIKLGKQVEENYGRDCS